NGCDMTVATGHKRAVGPAIHAQRVAHPLVRNRLIDFRHEERSHDRRPCRRDKHAVVASREESGDRSGGITAFAVSDEPLAPFGSGEIAAHRTAEADRQTGASTL